MSAPDFTLTAEGANSPQRVDLRSRAVGKYEWAAGKLADMAREENDPHLKRLFENAATIAALKANRAASQIEKLTD